MPPLEEMRVMSRESSQSISTDPLEVSAWTCAALQRARSTLALVVPAKNADALQFVARTLPFLDRRDRSPADCTSIAVSDALVVSNSTRPIAARASASREAFLFLAVRLRTVKLWSKTDPLSVWRIVSSNWVSDTRMRALALVIRAVPPRTRSRERGALVVSAVSPPQAEDIRELQRTIFGAESGGGERRQA